MTVPEGADLNDYIHYYPCHAKNCTNTYMQGPCIASTPLCRECETTHCHWCLKKADLYSIHKVCDLRTHCAECASSMLSCRNHV